MNYLKNRRFALFIAGLVVLITLLPYLVGYCSQGNQWRFSGFVIGVEDGNSYLAKMLSGSAGDWLFRSPYSSYYQRGVIAFLPYILLGKLASEPARHEQLVALYQLFRIAGIFAAVFASYDFISIFLKRKDLRNWALLLIIFGGGSGWILVLLQQKHFLGSVPLEFISPESFGFLGLLGFPHLAASRGLFLWGLTAYLKSGNGYRAGIFWLLLGFFQPMFVVLAWVVIGVHSLIFMIINVRPNEIQIANVLTKINDYLSKPIQAVIVSSPIVIYTGYVFITDPYLVGWISRNKLSAPHIGHYLISYGLMLPLVYFGIRKLIKDNLYQGLLIACWLFLLPIILNSPVNSQRRLAEGAWVVIVISAIAFFVGRKPINWKWSVYLGQAFLSTLILILGSISTATNLSTPVFRPSAEVDVYHFLGQVASDRPVILSSFEIGNNIPAWIPATVVLGHGAESIERERIDEDLEKLYSLQISDQEQKAIIDFYGIDYLIWGPTDSNLREWNPEQATWLKEIYDNGEFSIYESLHRD